MRPNQCGRWSLRCNWQRQPGSVRPWCLLAHPADKQFYLLGGKAAAVLLGGHRAIACALEQKAGVWIIWHDGVAGCTAGQERRAGGKVESAARLFGVVAADAM